MTAQTSIFDEPPAKTEYQLAQEILESMITAYPGRTERYARLARYLCHRNIGLREYLVPHTVTSDDIREFGGIESDKRSPDDYGPKSGTRNNWIASIFACKIDGKRFKLVGQKRSRTKGSHGRKIGLYTTEEYYPIVKEFLRKNSELA